ncbi:MAG TPA: hypothetical protein VGO58_19230 [Chitinophagaceae bacterium]|jgi:hypothetical protein|nr:hypothetical protein [Chitinophagaceae bacterium]
MKTILIALFITGITGCYTSKEIEVEMVQAELIRIDTISRHPDNQKMLTWRDQDQIDYVSYAAMHENYSLGLRMMVMRRR